jgi:hypothetical protein
MQSDGLGLELGLAPSTLGSPSCRAIEVDVHNDPWRSAAKGEAMRGSRKDTGSFLLRYLGVDCCCSLPLVGQ